MTTFSTGARRSLAVLCAAALAAGSAGCGGGGDDSEGPAVPPTGAATSTAPAAGPSFASLANAVCRAETSDVPPVPDPGASAVAGRRYVTAVEDAAGGLASAFAGLERRRPESQATLAPLVTRAEAVAAAARLAVTKGGARAADVQDSVRIAIARLNEGSTAASLPGCAI